MTPKKPTYEELEKRANELETEASRCKQAEEELRESKQILEDIAQGITESIFLLSKDFKILWANKAAERETGLPLKKLIGNYCYKVTHHLDDPCSPPNEACPVHELEISGKAVAEEHIHFDNKNRKIFVEVSAYPVKDQEGNVVKYVHVTKNITERKQMEQEKEQLIQKLQESLSEVKTLSGLLPICASCKKIRDDKGYWNRIEDYIKKHSTADFSHGICPDCARKLYPQFFDEEEKD